MSETTRRSVLAGAAGVGAAAALAACGSDSGSSGSGGQTTGAPPGGAATSAGGAAGALGKTSDVPVGGGKIFAAEKVVVTQPTAGDFKGFSAVCTHMGCIVATVQDSTINCKCHGSQYSAADGSVKKGPATKPLASAPVKVDGDNIVLG